MFGRFKSKRPLFLLAVAAIMVVLNLYTLATAYPTLDKPLNLGDGDLPRDFSVYYVAASRMFHNPAQIFCTQTLRDDPAVYPAITPYKYLPSFLVLVSPLLPLGCYRAFWVFDAL